MCLGQRGDGEKNLRTSCHRQEAVVVERPIAPGASSESFAPLGYRTAGSFFFSWPALGLKLSGPNADHDYSGC